MTEEVLSLLEQAEKCRRLAKSINDEAAAKGLRKLADDFMARANGIMNATEPDERITLCTTHAHPQAASIRTSRSSA
jgi:hypothetical protein